MRDFSRIYLTEPNKNIEADTNEVVGLILATMILSTALRPALGGDSKGSKDGGGVGFWDFMINYSNNRRADRKEKEEKAEKEKAKKERAKKKAEKEKAEKEKAEKEKAEEDNKIFNDLLILSRKANAKEKDENSKKKNDAMIKLLTACSFDKDGNELPIEERIGKMKDNMSDEQFESFKKDMLDTYEKCKDDDKFKDALNKEREKITPETYEKAMEESKKEAKTTLEQLAKEKKEIEEHEAKLKEIEEQLKNADDDKKKELTAQLEKEKQNAPQTLAGAASGVTTTATTTSEPEPKSDGEKDVDNAGKQEDDDETNQDGYEVKDEEITDPETGEKKKVKTYTGPRGGKFYYPDGAPKKPENKVYVEHLSLSDYLIESMQ